MLPKEMPWDLPPAGRRPGTAAAILLHVEARLREKHPTCRRIETSQLGGD